VYFGQLQVFVGSATVKVVGDNFVRFVAPLH
jgi:hypothetical protein